MARSLFITLIGAASLGAALIVGCSDKDAKPAASKAGESCVRTADCADGLSCFANVCYASAQMSSGGESGQPSGPPLPSLGSEGESCSSRLDCEAGLGCFNQRCTTPPTPMTGEGGATGMGIELGERGETCRVNGDCKTDLRCIPSTTAAGVGVCDLSKYGVAPTGKKCGGECSKATDCCELPTALQVDPIKSCKDIDDAITAGPINCTAPTTAAQQKLCFEQATYCSGCSAQTWDCKDNTCVYKPACVPLVAADTATGCPTYSRINNIAALVCNADTMKCTGPTATGCTTDASCVGKPVFDRAALSADVCSAGECTCYTGNHECYRKCTRDIECGGNATCDTKTTHLCTSSGACSSDSQCAVQHNSLDFKCDKDMGKCRQSCASDHDCSPSGHGTPTFNAQVCGADGFCALISADCEDDTQCASTPSLANPNALRTFCVADKGVDATATFSSAISD